MSGSKDTTVERTIVLVGHCGADMYLLKSAVRRAVPDVNITSANDTETLNRLVMPASVVLVNRVLDGDFPDESGIELIRSLKRGSNPPTMMLISNHADAQAEAIAAGAKPGFGKSQLYHESTVQRLRAAVVQAQD